MFENASRIKLRFNTPKGLLTVEDLWDLPLISRSSVQANLDDIARDLHNKLKDANEISFVKKATKDNEKLKLAFDIIKHVIAVRLAEDEAAATAANNRAKKQQLLALIAHKENDELAGKSLEDLKKLAEELN